MWVYKNHAIYKDLDRKVALRNQAIYKELQHGLRESNWAVVGPESIS